MKKEETVETMNADEADLLAASENTKNRKDVLKKLEYNVKLPEPYEFEGETYDSVDVSEVKNLTTRDAELLDKTMNLMGHNPGSNKFYDTLYMKQVAVRVTHKPIEFFNAMSMKNFEAVKSRLLIYFLFE